MKNVKTILFLLFVGGSMIVIASTMEKFTNKLNAENLTFTEDTHNYTRIINISKTGSLKNASINLTGIIHQLLSAETNNIIKSNTGICSFGGGDATNQINYTFFINTTYINITDFRIVFVTHTCSDSNISILNFTNSNYCTLSTRDATSGSCFGFSTTDRKLFSSGCGSLNNVTDFFNQSNNVVFQTCVEDTNNELTLQWNYTSYPLNFTLYINNTKVYTNITGDATSLPNKSFFNGSLSNFQINRSVLETVKNSCNENNCSVNFTFEAKSIGILEYAGIYIQVNEISNATNVSITPQLPSQGNTLTGHTIYNDSDNDKAIANFTRWYINNSPIFTNNGSFTLTGTNVSELSNITFEVFFNDSYDEGVHINSSTITIGDTLPPRIDNTYFSSSSITDGNQINISVNSTEIAGFLNQINVSVKNPDGLILNRTCNNLNKPDYICNTTFFDGDETSVVGVWNLTSASSMDNSLNSVIIFPNTTFTVNAQSSGVGTSGGGGASPKAILLNGTPLLSFGTPLIQFIVLRTPSEQEKRVRFVNLGNVTFQNGFVIVKGDASKFIKPFVCDLNIENCKDKGIEVRQGESAFLVLNGSFNSDLGDGVDGVISLSEDTERKATFELDLLVSRPPFWKVAINPINKLSGGRLGEIPSLIIAYSGIVLIGFLGVKGLGGLL